MQAGLCIRFAVRGERNVRRRFARVRVPRELPRLRGRVCQRRQRCVVRAVLYPLPGARERQSDMHGWQVLVRL